MVGQIANFIVNAIGYGGYTGIFLLMFLESTFFPFPSEVVVPPAAYLAAKGKMDIALVILSGSLGSLFGAWFNYWLSYKFGYPFLLKYGKYVGLGKKGLDRVDKFFKEHGEISTFIGRLLPGIRQYISLPAGVARMNFFRFSLFTFFGALIWVCVLAFVGFSVGNNVQLVKKMVHEAYVYIIAFSVIVVGVYVMIKRRRA
ncbi:DedA family protein [Hippea alviniae]|uniref:DedA family protein n=1 Tax=Hippea alviniae TaxID=1279027 RepID=UPI0003B44A2E|nr:DedA family protein [Hippea alviniae]